MNTIIASADVVAADAISARLIGLNPLDFEYLTLAAYKGLGQCDLDRIKVKGSAMEQVAVRIDPTGRFLLVANQKSGNIVVFGIDPETGLLADSGHWAEVPMPVCVKMVLR